MMEVLIVAAALIVCLPVLGALVALAGWLVSAGFIAVADRLFP